MEVGWQVVTPEHRHDNTVKTADLRHELPSWYIFYYTALPYPLGSATIPALSRTLVALGSPMSSGIISAQSTLVNPGATLPAD
jgi:hypothetical protein